MFDTEAAAIAAVRDFQANGVRSIDVGCMQVNLMYHPGAFASLEQAFDPEANAAYAARFLRALFGESQDWPTAAGAYHSRTPALGNRYRELVMARWAASGVTPPASGTVRSAAHPFHPPPLAAFAPSRPHPSDAATRLLEIALVCDLPAAARPREWLATSRAPDCGRSPFMSTAMLQVALAAMVVPGPAAQP